MGIGDKQLGKVMERGSMTKSKRRLEKRQATQPTRVQPHRNSTQMRNRPIPFPAPEDERKTKSFLAAGFFGTSTAMAVLPHEQLFLS